MTKLVAVAKVDSQGHDIHEQQQFSKGDTFNVISEPIDFMTTVIFMQIESRGDLDKAVLVDFGESFIVFYNEESDIAWNVNDYFELKEVN